MNNTHSEENELVDIKFYNINKGVVKDNLHISLPPGDLYKTCNVLHDYCAILAKKAEEDDGVESSMLLTDYIGKLKKIQYKLEEALDYDVAKAIEKCKKKRANKKEDDIGEEALALAMKRGKRKDKTDIEQKTSDSKEKEDCKQLELHFKEEE